jgi:hypothetical protein
LNKYDYSKFPRGSFDGWDKKQSAWRPASGVCNVCKEEYLRSRRLSRSSDTEYDHGTWVCIEKYEAPKDLFQICQEMIDEHVSPKTT